MQHHAKLGLSTDPTRSVRFWFSGSGMHSRSTGLIRLVVAAAAILAVTAGRISASEGAGDGSEQHDPFTGQMFSELSFEERALLQEYQRNYLRLKDFYENVTIETRGERFSLPRSAGGVFPPTPSATLELTRSGEMIFLSNGGDFLRMDSAVLDTSSSPGVGANAIVIVTPTEGFRLRQSPSSGNYALVAHGKEVGEYLSSFANFLFHFAPFANLGVPLEYRILSDREASRIESVELRSELGEDIVVVSRLTDHDGAYSRLTFQFYRDRCWALKESRYECLMSRDPGETELNVIVERCVYDGEDDGIPLLAKYTREGIRGNKSTNEETIHRRKVFEIQKITPGAVPLAEFDVDQLIGRIGEKTTVSRFRIIAMTIGAILVVIGVWLRRRTVKAGA